MNIEWLKNKLGEKFYPITHVGSVLYGDSNETLETKLVALDESIGTKANSSDLTDHTGNSNNPHNVTAEQTPYDNTESGLSAQNVQDAVDEVNTYIQKSNDCLSYYGLKNEYIGDFEQGCYIDVSGNGDIISSSNQKYDKTHYACSSGDKVKIITDKRSWIGIAFYKSDGTFISGNEVTNTKENIANAPTESSYFMYYINRDAIVKTIYINNAIDEVNSNLDNNSFGEKSGTRNIAKGYVCGSTSNQYTSALFVDCELVAGETYTISFVGTSGNYLYTNENIIDTHKYITCNGARQSITVTLKSELQSSQYNSGKGWLLLKNNAGNSVVPNFSNVQVEVGSTMTDYQKYIASNKMLAENKADKSEVTTNLLKPTLETTTVNGVTCTNNGDGTYTLNGTASDSVYLGLSGDVYNLIKNNTYRLCGCPSGGGDNSYYLYTEVYDENHSTISRSKDYGSSTDFENNGECVGVVLCVKSGVTVPNLVFKPMITTNLSATYDDFVPFTGTTGKLNGDVAELEKSNEGKMGKENPTGTGAFSMNRKADTTVGENSTTEGNDCTASGNYSHAEGLETNATQERAHAEGYGTNASGYQAHTEGHWTVASGQSSHAEGESTLAQGYETHAEGNGTKAIGNFCHVEGHNTTALSDASHSEGSSTNRAPDSITSSSTKDDIISSWNSSKFSLAKGAHSHVEGCDCLALGDGSHAEGARTKAVGDMSHSGGCATEATGRSSCAIGEMVSARYDYQTAIGILNHNKEENIFEVGNGISDSTGIEKSNALELTRTGDLAIAGDFYFTDANGNKISMRDILTRLVALEPGFSVDVEG